MTSARTAGRFEALMDYLTRARGFDFAGYKRSTLERRVRKHMGMVGARDFDEYTDFLEVHPEEFTQLFNTILINVTGFFRDTSAWDYLAREIIPAIVSHKKPGDSIRIWSAGCASGEEAYSLAMLWAEALGRREFRTKVKIYATDVDEEALAQARQGVYTAKDVKPIPPDLLGKYFDVSDDQYVFSSEMRRSVIFGRHDLVQDAPISRQDLLVCRNTLMYFNAEAQSRILARFHFALNDDGFLFAGKAELLSSHAKLFVPVELRQRIFSKVPKAHARDRMVVLAQAGDREAADNLGQYVRIREVAFDTAPAAQLIVDVAGTMLLANDRARTTFSLRPEDQGKALQDLELSYRPVELRSLVERAYSEGRVVKLDGVERILPGGDLQYLDVRVTPLKSNGQGWLGVSITYQDVTESRRLRDDLQRSNQETEAAYEELQSANEELETTNEELQSTVEELETTNEELQSTNEEMETMNEELQSTNEELQALNEELHQRTDELDDVNAFLKSVLTSLRSGVAAIDRKLMVGAWNHRMEDLWGLRADEVLGRPFLRLDIGLPVGKLKKQLRAVLAGDTEFTDVELAATNRRGRAIRCRITVTPRLGPGGDVQGAILLVDDEGSVKEKTG